MCVGLIACRETSSEVANTFDKSCVASFEVPKTRVATGGCLHKRTYLDKLVPAGGDDDGVLGVGGEPDARDPFGVALVGDGELAVTECVPELDCAVSRAGNNLAVVGGEGDGEDVVGVANEPAGGGAGRKLPEAQGLVPRGGEGIGTIRGDNLHSVSAIVQFSYIGRLFSPLARELGTGNVRSPRRCGSGRGESAWGSRIATRRGSGSR